MVYIIKESQLCHIAIVAQPLHAPTMHDMGTGKLSKILPILQLEIPSASWNPVGILVAFC